MAGTAIAPNATETQGNLPSNSIELTPTDSVEISSAPAANSTTKPQSSTVASEINPSPEPAQPPPDPPTPSPVPIHSRIVYVTTEGGNRQIVVMNPDGSGQRLVTDTDRNWDPAWSPDGSRIAFVSIRRGVFSDIFVMNAGGSGVRPLTRNDSKLTTTIMLKKQATMMFQAPTWSPDGSRIAYSQFDHAPNFDKHEGVSVIYTVDANTSGVPQSQPLPARSVKLEIADAWPDWSPDGSKLVLSEAFNLLFVVGSNIVVSNTDGSNSVKLTESQTNLHPAWSPDGKKIAYSGFISQTSEVSQVWDIFVMNADGEGNVNLTQGRSEDSHPTWSPDGKRIAFHSNRTGRNEIYVMNADGSDVRQVTFDGGISPDWGPPVRQDGSPVPPITSAAEITQIRDPIVFTSNRDGTEEIYMMSADGSSPVNLTRNPGRDSSPSWSPDGGKITFLGHRDGNGEIYIMNADGSNQIRLTYTSENENTPSWSPDGNTIAFLSRRDGNREIYVMNTDGSNQVRLTDNTRDDWMSSWSPDGSKIAFTSTLDRNMEVYVMNADGTNQVRLTNSPGFDSAPLWSPDGRSFVFSSDRDGNFEIYVMDADGANKGQVN